MFSVEPKTQDAPLENPLRGIPNAVLTPHVGGSTEEAQEKIGVEVANKLVGFSDSGATVASVNFPELSLPEHEDAHRILHIHHNVPGVLRSINDLIGDEGINVLGQYLQTRGKVGYVVLDIERETGETILPRLRAIEGTIRSRILY